MRVDDEPITTAPGGLRGEVVEAFPVVPPRLKRRGSKYEAFLDGQMWRLSNFESGIKSVRLHLMDLGLKRGKIVHSQTAVEDGEHVIYVVAYAYPAPDDLPYQETEEETVRLALDLARKALAHIADTATHHGMKIDGMLGES